MKQEFLKIIQHFSERKAVNQKTKVSIFFICFSIALFIWFLTKMSEEYTTTVNFPITYINPPTDQIITHAYDSLITVELKSRGFDLLSMLFFESKKPVKINLSGIQPRKSRYQMSSYVLTRNIYSQIIRQIELTDRITRVLPDTLYFNLEQIVRKKVSVEANLQFTLKPQYNIYGHIKISPDSIFIYGPPSMLDSIVSIQTLALNYVNLDKNISDRIKLNKPLNKDEISMSTDSVNLFIPVEKFTENVVEKPIIINNGDREAIKLFPENVRITFMIALKDYSNFQPDMLSAGINFDKDKNRQKITILHQPSFIKITNIEPEMVEYIIIK